MPAITDIGRFIIISFPEDVPSDDTLHYILDNKIGGIILFANHCRNQDNLKGWLNDFKKSTGNDFLIAVDQEGGRVSRFSNRFPTLEAPRYYGSLGKLSKYESDLSRVCERLRQNGINFNLVPTVDLFDTGEDHVLDSRTFSDDSEIVSRFARITIDVHNRNGILTCAKHFPGLGRSRGDPHFERSISDLKKEDFFKYELRPFKDVIEYGIDAVMVTHLHLPGEKIELTTVSDEIINGWLKSELSFEGPVIADDLNMAAAASSGDSLKTAFDSFAAGIDIMIFGREFKNAQEAILLFSKSYMDCKIEEDRITQANQRLLRLRKKLEEWG